MKELQEWKESHERRSFLLEEQIHLIDGPGEDQVAAGAGRTTLENRPNKGNKTHWDEVAYV